jgi:two-component system, OmpR family, sensor kinase
MPLSVSRPSIFKSLRWRLQAWHALILLLAVAGFGSVLYFEVRKARYDEIDAELLAAARTLDGVLRAIPRPILGDRPGQPFDDPRRAGRFDDPQANRPRPLDPAADGLEGEFPPPRRGDPQQRPPPEDPLGRPPLGQRPRGNLPNDRPLARDQLDRMLELPRTFVERYDQPGEEPYFVVFANQSGILKSVGLPDQAPPQRMRLRQSAEFDHRQRGIYREIALQGPENTQILVGRSIEHEQASLAVFFWQMVLTGTAVFAVGLAGGWWLSRRAVQPIETMSATAASISAAHLDRRIDVAGADNELAALGRVLNAMFDRLEAAFHQQMRFTADASHELRTPLAIVLTNAEVALGRPRSPEEYREALEVCAQAARRMKHLADDLLVLARADAGRLELQSVSLDLKEIASETAALIAPLAQEKKIDIAVTGDSACAHGDPDRLLQVVTNLVSNAINYNREGGRVTLETSTTDAHALLTVADTGAGISEADLPHVFDRFYRADQSRTRQRGGAGLGLSICKTIVESHGGSIEIASQQGRGTTVTICLPLTQRRKLASADTAFLPPNSQPLFENPATFPQDKQPVADFNSSSVPTA